MRLLDFSESSMEFQTLTPEKRMLNLPWQQNFGLRVWISFEFSGYFYIFCDSFTSVSWNLISFETFSWFRYDSEQSPVRLGI